MKAYFLWLAKFITVLVVMIIAIPALIAAIAAVSAPEDLAMKKDKNKVAVVELIGPIFDSKEIVKKLYKQANNDSIKGIVLRVNSPGGAVAPSQDIFQTVKLLKEKKPIVVSMGSVAASGGLYASLSANKIFVQPGTQTGSIGVIVQVPNFKKLADKVGVDFLTVTSGQLKDVGNPTREITDLDRKFFKQTIDKIYAQFLKDVATSRNLKIEKVKKFADGRLILGSEAVTLGLADDFGDVYTAASEIFSILEKPLPEGESPTLVYTEDKFEQFKEFLDASFKLPSKLLNSDWQFSKKPVYMFY